MQNLSSHYDLRLLNLKSSVFLSTYRRKDLSQIVNNLSSRSGTILTTDYDRWNKSESNYNEIYKIWKNANFNPSSIRWTNYYPGEDFEQELVDDVSFYLRLGGVHRAWISRLDPGFYAPHHWDVDDDETEYLKKGTPVRYSIFLNNPTMGHILIIGTDYLYEVPWGSIFKWKNYREWHTGINGGLESNYLLHILGYQS